MENEQILENAIEQYFGRGWECFPVRLRHSQGDDKKIPTFSKAGWKKTYTLNEAIASIKEINATGVCIRTGSANNLLVVELDNPIGKAEEFLKNNGIEIPEDTYSVISQSNGKHYYFEWDTRLDNSITSKSRIFGEDIPIDSRGNGGIIYAPPTYVIGAGQYRVLNNGIVRKPSETLVAKLLQVLPLRTVQGDSKVNALKLEEIENLLNLITQNGTSRLSYDDWLYAVSCVWSAFSFDESLPLLQKYLPEESPGELEKKYLNRLTKVSVSNLKNLLKGNLPNEKDSMPDVFIISNTGKLRLDAFKIVKFLEENGYGKIKRDGNVEYVRIKNNVIYESSIIEMKDFVRRSIEASGENENLMSQFFTTPLFRSDRIDGICGISSDFHRSSFDTSFLYFKNGFLKIKAESKSFHPYSELQKPIRESQIIKQDFLGFENASKEHRIGLKMPHEHEECAGDGEMLVDHVCAMDNKRIRALRSAIGYLCHPAKDPSISKAILLLDENVSDDASGRSGKSLITKMVSHVRNAVVQDGKQFYSMDRFKFDRVNSETDVLIFDDVQKDFQFEVLYNALSDGFECRKRYRDTIRVGFEESAKVALTSNFGILGNSGDSDKGRRAEYELYPWYDLNFTPKKDFGKLLFSEWDSEEWNRFYCFIVKCLQAYLKGGLIEVPPINAQYRKLIQSTSETFGEWCKEFFYWEEKLISKRMNTIFRKEDLLRDFFDYAPEYAQEQKFGKFSRNKFTKWLKIFCDLYNIKTIEEQRRIDGSTGQYCITFINKEAKNA